MRELNPIHLILWRLIWVGPIWFFRLGFVFFILLALGPRDAKYAWRVMP